MPAKDVFHECVKHALIKDGWTITHDPYTISFYGKEVYIDMAAERFLAAERAGEKIAVEVKTFAGHSDIRDFEEAVGQYIVYRSLLDRKERNASFFSLFQRVHIGIQ